ncbi:MAG: DUF3563 domain-containing protein [Proteobacteria bacterium]|nr:DUF3563 domain-containing protein [Pseudomonadota bacterium]MBS0571769.1 DUF3563 domain-containing protein [Pseudomonadota bacterium]
MILRFLFRLFSFPPRHTLELAYLRQAVSRHDLERREREIDRGLFSGR